MPKFWFIKWNIWLCIQLSIASVIVQTTSFRNNGSFLKEQFYYFWSAILNQCNQCFIWSVSTGYFIILQPWELMYPGIYKAFSYFWSSHKTFSFYLQLNTFSFAFMNKDVIILQSLCIVCTNWRENSNSWYAEYLLSDYSMKDGFSAHSELDLEQTVSVSWQHHLENLEVLRGISDSDLKLLLLICRVKRMHRTQLLGMKWHCSMWITSDGEPWLKCLSLN